MQSFFKTEKVTVDGHVLTIKELSVKDHLDFPAFDKEVKAATICARCVDEWKSETPETINANVPARVLGEVMHHIFRLSGLDEPKNSEATPDAGSSTA